MSDLTRVLEEMTDTTRKLAVVVKSQNNEIHALRMTLGTLIAWTGDRLGERDVKQLLDMMGDYPE